MSLINLLRGWPAPSLLAAEPLRVAANHVLTATGDALVETLEYGADPGYQPLREQLATFLSQGFRAHAAPRDPERLCITGGASQSMACILQSFSDPGFTSAVWVSAPCYHLMCPLFDDAGFAGRLRGVPEDDEGIDVAVLERGFQEAEAYRHIVYVVPTSSNPSGRTMTVARRKALVRLARRYDALVVADDVYDFLQWPVGPSSSQKEIDLPTPLPRLVDVDRQLDGGVVDRFGHAVSNGSFSKLVSPGVRTGWVEGTPAFAYGLAQTGSTKSGGAPSQLCASMLADMLKTGALQDYLRTVVRPALQRRHRLLVDAVHTHLKGLAELVVSDQDTYGGYFVWLRLLHDRDADDVAARAMAQENLVVPAGSMFAVKDDAASQTWFARNVRLCFSWEDEDRLVEGVQRLGRVLRDWYQHETIEVSADMNKFK